MMFGFACDETPGADAPAHFRWHNSLSRRLAQVRKEGVLPWLRPDGKCQVTVIYEDGRARSRGYGGTLRSARRKRGADAA